MKTKTCSKCHTTKPLAAFGREPRAKDGRRYSCRECDRQRSREYVQRNREARRLRQAERRRLHPEADRVYSQRYRLKNRAKDLLRHCKMRAVKTGLPYDLDQHARKLQRRIDAGRCELTGLPFNLTGGRTWDSPSFDRIVPSRGYVYRNIRVVCHAMNCALGSWGPDVLLRVIRAWVRHSKKG